METTGRRLRYRLTGHNTFGPLIADAPARELAFILGPDVVRAQFDFDDATQDALAALAAVYFALVAKAQSAVRKLLKPFGVNESALIAAQQIAREAGWAALEPAVADVIAARTFEPAGAATGSSSTRVPPEIVRQAVDVAGGETAEAVATSAPNVPDGGVATGRTVEDAMTRSGFTRLGYLWSYGDGHRPNGPFPAHKALDQVEFRRWDDPRLAVNEQDLWLGVMFYAPGDHKGCQCDAAPIFNQER